jgi:hypothetical protein
VVSWSRVVVLTVAYGLVGCSGAGSESATPRTTSRPPVSIASEGRRGPSTSSVSTPPGSTTSVVEVSATELDKAVRVVSAAVPVDARLASCLPRRLAAEPALVRTLVGSDDATATAVSVVRGCERAASVADGWIGPVDHGCLFTALSDASSDEVAKFQSEGLNPDGSQSSRVGAALKRCVR